MHWLRRQASSLRGRVILERDRGLILIYMISFEGMAKYYASCAASLHVFFNHKKVYCVDVSEKNQSEDVIKGIRNA